MQFNVHEAKTQFSRLLDLVENGEEVVIARNGEPVAQLVRRKNGTLQLGSGKDDTDPMTEDWWRAMTDDEAEAFLDGRW